MTHVGSSGRTPIDEPILKEDLKIVESIGLSANVLQGENQCGGGPILVSGILNTIKRTVGDCLQLDAGLSCRANNEEGKEDWSDEIFHVGFFKKLGREREGLNL